ncbi:hypothetical protein BH23BAC3_BH23BAC3_18440 [soil metagenome]
MRKECEYKQETFPFIHQDIEYSLKDFDFSNMDALQKVTINAAITLELESELESLDENKKAILS